ncbi:MAG TPA: hypothetical protein VFA81_12010, partial [Burkholderiales bacterium]|nr:hypothetical protein [Burkholderiales bacterium]
MKRTYSRPWRHGSAANPGKIPTCVQVSVRPETTGTLETMLAPRTQLPASRAGLARVGRIHVLHLDAYRMRFVFHKALQLSEGPAVQSSTHAPTCPDALTDVGEILHHDLGCPDPTRFRDNAFARFVINVSDTPPLSAGDLPECLSGTLAAVGLQATTQGQMLIAP